MGRFSQMMLTEFLNHPGYEVASVCDPRVGTDVEMADMIRRLGVRTFVHASDLLMSQDVDAVYVASPPATHRELVLGAIRSGVHVLCEKPLGIDARQTDEIRRASAESDSVVAVHFPLQYDGVGSTWRTLRASDFHGRLRHGVVTIRCPRWPRPYQNVDWVAGRTQGGPILEIGTHLLQLLISIYGDLRVAWRRVEHVDGRTADGDPLAEVGVRAELRTPDGAPIDLLVQCQVAGTEDVSIVVDGEAGTVAMLQWGELSTGRSGEPLVAMQVDRTSSVLDEWHGAIHGGVANLVTPEHAHRVQLLVDAIRFG